MVEWYFKIHRKSKYLDQKGGIQTPSYSCLLASFKIQLIVHSFQFWNLKQVNDKDSQGQRWLVIAAAETNGSLPIFICVVLQCIRWGSVPYMLFLGHGQCWSEGKAFALLTLCVITPKKDSQKLPEMELLRLLLIFPGLAVQISSYLGTEMGNTASEEIPLFSPFPLQNDMR